MSKKPFDMFPKGKFFDIKAQQLHFNEIKNQHFGTYQPFVMSTKTKFMTKHNGALTEWVIRESTGEIDEKGYQVKYLTWLSGTKILAEFKLSRNNSERFYGTFRVFNSTKKNCQDDFWEDEVDKLVKECYQNVKEVQDSLANKKMPPPS